MKIGQMKKGFTLVELMIVVVILAIMIGGAYFALTTGESTWFSTDASITVQQNLRQTVEKMTRELTESGLDQNGVAQYTVNDGTGVNGSDTIRFSIPVICHTGDNVIDANTDVAHWGAPLTWGCTSSSCMDADDVCATVEYKYVYYLLGNNNQLLRRVLNPGGVTIREDILADGILDLQMTVSADLKVITLNITAQKNSALNRLITAATSIQVFLRNRG